MNPFKWKIRLDLFNWICINGIVYKLFLKLFHLFICFETNLLDIILLVSLSLAIRSSSSSSSRILVAGIFLFYLIIIAFILPLSSLFITRIRFIICDNVFIKLVNVKIINAKLGSIIISVYINIILKSIRNKTKSLF